MVAERRLGRGLDALLKGYQGPAETQEVRMLPLDAIVPNPDQPRHAFPEQSLQELAESIRAQGVLQPVLVRPLDDSPRPLHQLIVGERRWRASKLAGMETIPAIVKRLSDEESLIVTIIENLQREDLNPIDEALGLQELKDRFALSQDQLSKKIGKSRPAVANALRLLQLPEPAQQDLKSGVITAGHARAILAVTEPASQIELLERILAEDLTVRQAESYAAHWKEHNLFPEPGDHAPSSPPQRRRVPRPAPDPELLDMRSRLTERFSSRVAISGQRNKGRIVFSFESEEEFARLVSKLGV